MGWFKKGGVVVETDVSKLASQVKLIEGFLRALLPRLGLRMPRGVCGQYPHTHDTPIVISDNPMCVLTLAKENAMRITQLECAVKGHGATKTCIETKVREVLCKTLHMGCDSRTRTHHETPITLYGKHVGTRTTVTCLDCGAMIEDTWKPKEAPDDPEA